MASIGSFIRHQDGSFIGQINSLVLKHRGICIVPEDVARDNAPSHRIRLGDAEIGAAWEEKSNNGGNYLRVKLEDPTLASPIYCNLLPIEGTEEYRLIWTSPPSKAE